VRDGAGNRYDAQEQQPDPLLLAEPAGHGLRIRADGAGQGDQPFRPSAGGRPAVGGPTVRSWSAHSPLKPV